MSRPPDYTKEWIEKEADLFEDWMKEPRSIYFKEFALLRGYHPNRLAEFAFQNEKFSGVYEKMKQWQEVKLVKGGLFGETKEGMSKFLLVAKHGFNPVGEQSVSTSQDKQIEDASDSSADLVGR